MHRSQAWGLVLATLLFSGNALAEGWAGRTPVSGTAQSGVAAQPSAQPASPDATPSVPTNAEPVLDPGGPEETRWYGWQLLVSDAASISVGVASASLRGGDEMIPLGVMGYLVAPIVIHATHGQGLRALASVGLRGGLPLVTALAAAIGASGCGSQRYDDCQMSWGIAGLVTGIVTGIAVDAALAREPVPRELGGLHIGPQLFVSERGTSVGLTGSF
jgi:hypothetical protein